jgi:hypothetical protein
MQQEMGSSEFENLQWQTDKILTVHQAVVMLCHLHLLRRVYVTFNISSMVLISRYRSNRPRQAVFLFLMHLHLSLP